MIEENDSGIVLIKNPDWKKFFTIKVEGGKTVDLYFSLGDDGMAKWASVPEGNEPKGNVGYRTLSQLYKAMKIKPIVGTSSY